MNQAAPIAPIAISLGDPAGIGPELICEAWVQRAAQNHDGQKCDNHACDDQARDNQLGAPFFAVYGAQVLRDAARRRGINCPIIEIGEIAQASHAFAQGLPVLAGKDGQYSPGMPDQAGAQLAFASLQQATSLAQSGAASALVTAPIAKSQLAKVGFDFPGQTEFLADTCAIAPENAVMMLAGPSLKTIPITIHCALADVPGMLSIELICAKARIAAAALARDFGIERPHLALAGLNPHAGENGKFGDEETRIITPAIDILQGQGINASGPYPADAMFTAHARGKYDAALCMYHDQALIPLKALDFDQGVNITLGLPIIRTSPDHGTAFDIAGRKIADPNALIAAIHMADQCARRRQNG